MQKRGSYREKSKKLPKAHNFQLCTLCGFVSLNVLEHSQEFQVIDLFFSTEKMLLFNMSFSHFSLVFCCFCVFARETQKLFLFSGWDFQTANFQELLSRTAMNSPFNEKLCKFFLNKIIKTEEKSYE